MSALSASKAHYDSLQKLAAKTAAETLRSYGINLSLLHYSGRVEGAIKAQWLERQVGWDWPAIARSNREFKSFCLAMWAPNDQLVGLALMTLSKQAVTLKFVEGRPSSDCTFKGKRILIALEVAANYAQGAGVGEIRIHPLNDTLAHLYESVYGFEVVKERKSESYYRKRI